MNESTILKLLAGPLLTAFLAFPTSVAFAETFEISVTNVTGGQAFTPRLAITHSAGRIFTPGDAASEELIAIAEAGDLAPMMEAGDAASDIVTEMQVGEGLLMPGATQVITIEGAADDLLSLVSMLIPTNDAFFGLNAITLPAIGSVTYRATVYDAGSETNDEICSNIPGPVCGGSGLSSDDDGEGFIYVHSGIHGVGDLEVASFDWNNPAAIITVTKLQ